jgi:arylsulfatase
MEMHPDLPVLPGMLAQAGYRTHGVGKLHLSRYWPAPDIADPVRFPESRMAWNADPDEELPSCNIGVFPAPYYGFHSVDFVGGHGDWVFGEYFLWLEEQCPDARRLLSKEGARELPTGAPECYKMGLPVELHYNRWISDRAVDYIMKASATDQPFFLWCSFPDPHEPYCPPAPYCDMYEPDEMPLPNRRAGELADLPPYYKAIYEKRLRAYECEGGPLPDAYWQEMRALTYGMITFVDTEIGRVLDRLEVLGLRENTIICFVSDHGDMMGDHWMIFKGPYMFEGCARIPLILSLPGGAKGSVHSGLVSQIDLVPTLLDACGVESPGEKRLHVRREGVPGIGDLYPLDLWPGKSLVEVILSGTDNTGRKAVVIHNDDPFLGIKIRTLVTDRFKLTFYPGHEFGELFDLQEDPGELHNLWNRPEWRQTRDRLQCQLLHEDTLLSPWRPLPYATS